MNVAISFQAAAFHALNGLTGAASLFLLSAGLSLIFGVTRIVNFAHGSFYMLGLYLACRLADLLGRTTPVGFWGAILAAALLVAAIGLVIEILILRRLYQSPELFQLLATFGLVLIIKDAVLAGFGAEELFGPRAPGLSGAAIVFDRAIPEYDLALMTIALLILGGLWFILQRSRFGILIRAASENRQMAGALGINQVWLFSAVFAAGSFLAALGGALQLPREPASLHLDLAVITDAFVVVVVGGLGSIPGAFVASLFIAEIKAICIALGSVRLGPLLIDFSKVTLAVEFIFMALVLVLRPNGLFGKEIANDTANATGFHARPARISPNWILICLFILAILVPLFADRYSLVLLSDIFIFGLFAAGLHFIMGFGGLISFGHAAFLGLGAYGVALLGRYGALPMPLILVLAPMCAALAAFFMSWFLTRLAGVYLAMLTLAFAQIIWAAVYQSNDITGGSNGVFGLWPPPPFDNPVIFYGLVLGICTLSFLAIGKLALTPFGFALRATRDSERRAAAIGIHVINIRVVAITMSAFFSGLAGVLLAYSKGSVSPDLLGIPRSVEGLVMVLLGGLNSMVGPIVGAAVFLNLQDALARSTEYWRTGVGSVILMIVLLFPNGIMGFAQSYFARNRR